MINAATKRPDANGAEIQRHRTAWDEWMMALGIFETGAPNEGPLRLEMARSLLTVNGGKRRLLTAQD